MTDRLLYKITFQLRLTTARSGFCIICCQSCFSCKRPQYYTVDLCCQHRYIGNPTALESNFESNFFKSFRKKSRDEIYSRQNFHRIRYDYSDLLRRSLNIVIKINFHVGKRNLKSSQYLNN